MNYEESPIEMIAAERLRQMAKGYDAAHDDEHADGEITRAAFAFALREDKALLTIPTPGIPNHFTVEPIWPNHWDRPQFEVARPGKMIEARIGDMVKAAAMLVAEIERLQRRGKKISNATFNAIAKASKEPPFEISSERKDLT